MCGKAQCYGVSHVFTKLMMERRRGVAGPLTSNIFEKVCVSHEDNVTCLVPITLAGKRKESVYRNRNFGYSDSSGLIILSSKLDVGYEANSIRDQRVHGATGILVAIRTTGMPVMALRYTAQGNVSMAARDGETLIAHDVDR
ncbi:hypothetical protein QTP88_003875 [Uroleucon formosanum]